MKRQLLLFLPLFLFILSCDKGVSMAGCWQNTPRSDEYSASICIEANGLIKSKTVYNKASMTIYGVSKYRILGDSAFTTESFQTDSTFRLDSIAAKLEASKWELVRFALHPGNEFDTLILMPGMKTEETWIRRNNQ